MLNLDNRASICLIVQIGNKYREAAIVTQNNDDLEYCSDFFKALAHPTRIVLVEDLAEGEKCVCDLAQKIDADISTVSRHLRELRNAGIVANQKRGNQVFYSLRTPCILNFLQCIRKLQ
ncbi:helix-turn-helix transcriptional regulator, ArsR family [Syntrophotalea carbinolica DSM 2380]|uniref:Helix-turn-helix transcriptional regulator, ArsR family n=1 Tax=Syntrophotalea carbinolica (strain DSM 2380 / NBRC 103641 / GraBd1) TaxID=338963 RepID=Q3A848_SYNC1|nr:helix-turn-helix transcriptional regulator, ArsR family [Syntrophotalea carbinolica DSM 2380]